MTTACGDDEDPDFHLGTNNRRAPGGTPSVTNDNSNGTNNATNNGGQPVNQLDPDEIVYLESNNLGVLEVRSIAFAAQKNRFLFEPATIEGATGDIASGDLTVSNDRRRIVFTPAGEGNRPLISVTVGGADAVAILSADSAPGVIHTPRTAADGDILFVAGPSNGAVFQSARLYRVRPNANATPQEIPLDYGTCDVVRDVAVHPSTAALVFLIRDACADFTDAGLFQLDTRNGATGRIFTAPANDPTSILYAPFVANYGHRLYVLGNGSFDVDNDFAADAQGVGVFEISPTTGEYVGLFTPDNADATIRAFTGTSDGQSLVLELDHGGSRDLFLTASTGLARLTNVGTARSPTLR